MQDQTHALFNNKTIVKLFSDIVVTEQQRNSANRWLELLESGVLDKERSNSVRFVFMVLQDILGYNRNDLHYEEENIDFAFWDDTHQKGVCVEAKGTNTKDLFSDQHRNKPEHKTPIKQTWDYMGRKENFDYGIATNYKDFVLIDKSKGYSKYHHFDYVEIKNNDAKLKEFIAIFSKQSIIDKEFLPRLYEESILEEQEFTKQFYKLYHETRLMLIKEFQNAEQVSKDEAIHYAQLFLNRLIFLWFAEDTAKVSRRFFTESVLRSLNRLFVWEGSRLVSDAIKNIFKRLDKGSKTPIEIFGFNGGLFCEEVPSKIFFNDFRDEDFFKDVLQYSALKKAISLDKYSQTVFDGFRNNLNPLIKNMLIMASFDFQSDLNVNILGHIFEQSLTDLEELRGSDNISRKLMDLSRNIRVGNSLIDDKKVSEDKAFSWKSEFKEILDNGGFDIIIGNPPYIRVQELKYKDIDYLKSSYLVAHERLDISIIFFELATRLVKEKGKIGFITSSQFMTAEYGVNLRKLLSSKRIEKFVDFSSLPVFESAITYPAIIIFSNNLPTPFSYFKIKKLNFPTKNNLASLTSIINDNRNDGFTTSIVDPKNLNEQVWNLSVSEASGIKEIFKGDNRVELGSFAHPSTGVTTGLDSVLLLDNQTIKGNQLEDKLFIKTLRGRNIEPWCIKGPFDYIFYPYSLQENETRLIGEDSLKQNFPKTYEYLLKYKQDLLNRKDSRKMVAENKEWYALIRKGKLDVFNSKKIVTPALTKHNSFAMDEDGSAFLTGGAGVFGIIQNELNNTYLLTVLNSKLIEYFLHSISTKKQNGYYSYLNTFLSQIPVIKLNASNQQPFIEKGERLSSNTKEIQSKINTVVNRFSERFALESLPKKLSKFYELDFLEFMNLAHKARSRKPSLKELDEWEEYFNSHKMRILTLINENRQLIEDIDTMVFDLYKVNEEQRKIIMTSLRSE